MIWKSTAIIYLSAVCFLYSCESSNKSHQSNVTYFDLPTFFKSKVGEFQKDNPIVLKTVWTNEETEQKELHIDNWNNELSAFLSIDLNKPAYQGYIQIDSVDAVVNYSFTNKDLELNAVRIVYENNIPIEIEIDKKTKNFLYHTDEKLHFYKDSLYSIEKKQKVILMNPNKYKITGIIK